MDDDAVGAITAVWHEDSTEAETWFKTVAAAYDKQTGDDGDQAPTWDGFAAELRRAAAQDFHSETIDGFLDHVEDLGDPIGVVAQLADENNLTEILSKYNAAVAAWDEGDGDGGGDGADGADEAAVGSPDAEHGEPELAVAADTVEFSQDAWFAYLKQWDGGWTGTEDTWSEFVAGFLYHAPDGSRDIAKQFVEQMAALAVAERITGLADYGIHVPGQPLTEAPAADLVDGGVVDEVSDEDEAPAAPESLDHLEHVVPLAEDVLAPALADLFEEIPEAAELSPEELEQLISEVLDEELAALDAG